MISAEDDVLPLDFRRILDALADPVVAADNSNTIVYINQAGSRLLDWPQEELIGRPLITIIPRRFQEAHLNGFRRYLETRTPRIIGHPIRVPALRRDGGEVDIELTLAALTMSDGRPMFVASLRDLRERVELERQLLVTRYLRAVNKAAAQLPSLLDLDSVLDTVVRTLVDDFGAALARIWIYDAAQNRLNLRASAGLSGATIESSRATIDVATYPYKVAKVARTRLPFVRNGLAGDPEFDQEWVTRENIAAVAAFPLQFGDELHGVLVHFADHSLPDELVEALTTFVSIVDTALSDVERLTREEEARAAAEEAERRFAFLAEASKTLSASLDYGETLATVGRLAVAEMADWCVVHVMQDDGSIHQLVAAHVDPAKEQMLYDAQFRFPVDPQSAGGIPHVLRTGESTLVPEITDEMIAGGVSDSELLDMLRNLGLGSLMTVPMEAYGQIVGAITFVSARADRHYGADDLALAQELTSRAALAVDNARLYRDVQESVRTRDQFLSSVSHDLKNPLTAIRGRAQILLRRARRMGSAENDQMERGLEEIVVIAGKMNTLINDLVDVARLRVGQPLALRCAPVDLVALVRQAAREQNQISPRHAIRVDSARSELVGAWDGARLERVLINLLSNAVKYSPHGGEIDVVIGDEETDDRPMAVVTVRDYGMGIPAAELPHIFEQYYRASNVVGKVAGTGIGLAGARQIVEQHGGSIEVESEEGRQTTFTVRLPLQRVQEPAPA